jgi:hypothetical protein
MKGDGVGFSSSIDGGGNCGVCVGVLGDESWADSGDEYVSKGGGLLAESSGCACFGATDVRLESPDEAFASRPSPIGCDSPPSVVGFGNFSLGDFRAVLAFEALDFVDTLDLTSFVRPNQEFLDTGLGSISLSSCSFDFRLGVAFLSCENSVSGGLGGLASLVTFPLRGVILSTDFDRNFSSDPTSVDSGVYRFGLFLNGVPKSSLLTTASLLCALLKLGYGRLLLDVAPGAEAVRASSGTTSDIGVEDCDGGCDSESFSLSFSLRFRCGDLITSPVSGSTIFGRELLDALCCRLASFSAFVRCLRSLGFSSGLLSRSLAMVCMLALNSQRADC